MTNKTSPAIESATYPVLPLRDIVVFPHMIVPLFVGREKSIRALEEVMGSDKQIMLATQINASDDDPASEAIYEVGTVANVLQLLKLPDGTVRVLVEGKQRANMIRLPPPNTTRNPAMMVRPSSFVPQQGLSPVRSRRRGTTGRSGCCPEARTSSDSMGKRGSPCTA